MATGDSVQTTYTVPAGYRAVVRSVVGTNENTAGGRFYLYLQGFVGYVHVFPAANSGVSIAMHQVTMAGQQIKCLTIGVDLHVHVSGYLLRDPAALQLEGAVEREYVGEQLTPLLDQEASLRADHAALAAE
jgi:hypothetical protein